LVITRTHDNRTPYAGAISGGGRGTAISRRKSVHRPAKTASIDIHRMTALGEGEVALFKDFGNANSSTRGLPCTHAGDIGAPSAGNTGLVVIQTHLSLGF
jgi:hypothetical protein